MSHRMFFNPQSSLTASTTISRLLRSSGNASNLLGGNNVKNHTLLGGMRHIAGPCDMASALSHKQQKRYFAKIKGQNRNGIQSSHILPSGMVTRSQDLHFVYSVDKSKGRFHTSLNTLQQGKTVPFILADIGEGITEVEVVEWFIKEGDQIHQFDKVCEVKSDKANVEITSRYDGTVSKLHYQTGDTAFVGKPLIDVTTKGAPSSDSSPKAEAQESTTVGSSAQENIQSSSSTLAPSSSNTIGDTSVSDVVEQSIQKVLTAPAVRRLARENKIDLRKVKSTGKNNRVLKEDVIRYLQAQKSGALPETTAAPVPHAAPSSIEQDKVVPIKGVMKAMVKSMTASARVPHLGYCDEIIMDELIRVRAEMKPILEKEGIKLSYMPFFIKAASIALKKYPILNSSISEDETNLIYHAHHNIGVAMDTREGLIVPNIKNVESKTIAEIASELNRLQQLGASGKLGLADLKGGTFTLSNIGTIGGTYTSPVIMLPEVAIAGIGKIQKLPRFNEKNEVVPMSMMNISWSADHRIIDGATVALFSNLFKSMVENPLNMLLHTK